MRLPHRVRLTAAIRGARWLAFTLWAVAGCSPIWTRLTPIPATDTLKNYEVVEVWPHAESAADVRYWCAVIIARDSVSGRTNDPHKGCPHGTHGDSTRFVLPLARVDSVRLQHENPGTYYLIGADVTLMVLYTIFSRCHDPLGCT